MSPLQAHLLTCLPQRRPAELGALAARLEALGLSPERLAAGEIPEGLSPRQRTALDLALEVGPCVDLAWRAALEAEGGAALLRLVVLEGGIRSPQELSGWTPERAARIPLFGRGQRVEQLARAAARCGVAWGRDLGSEIPPVVPREARSSREIRERAEADGLSPLPRDWRRALLSAGGAALLRRARDAGIDSPEALARLSSGDVARLGGWGRVRLQQLRRAALSVGLDWGADLERRPGAPSLSGEGGSPRFSVALPAAVAAQVEALATAEGEPVSAWIRRAVEAAVASGGGGS